MLHHRLLIGFLNTPLGNNVQKTSKRHFLNHIKHFVSLFLSCTFFMFFYVLWNKSKNLLGNKMKDLTLKSLISPSLSFFKIISYDGPNIYDIHKGGNLKFIKCLRILLFLSTDLLFIIL